jgi:hypothetical protein
VLNNSTRTFDKYDVDIHASFYDSTDALVGSDQGFIDADRLLSGDRSAFDILITDDAIRNEGVTYDLIINDERVLEGASVDGDSNNEENGVDDEDEDNNN